MPTEALNPDFPVNVYIPFGSEFISELNVSKSLSAVEVKCGEGSIFTVGLTNTGGRTIIGVSAGIIDGCCSRNGILGGISIAEFGLGLFK